MNFIESIPYLIGQLATTFKVKLDKKLKEIDLHGGQIFVLLHLWEQEGLTQIQIAKELNLSAPTVHKMIKSLMYRNYIECRQCQDDARQIRVFLTTKGMNIKESVRLQWIAIENDLLINFTETEKLILIQLFGKLKENLHDFNS